MKLTNKQLKQIIKEEINKVLEGESTARTARKYPELYSKEQRVLLRKLINGEISVEDLDDYQLELMNQKTDYLSQGAFSGPDHYGAYDTNEYGVWQAIEAELKKRRNRKGSDFNTMDRKYKL